VLCYFSKFEKAEVKEVLLKWINKFAIQKDTAALKMGKLTCNTNQRNAVYKLPLEENNGIEYGFIESFCMLFDLRDRLRKMRSEMEEKEYTSKYTNLSGNHIFNQTVYKKCSFFESIFAPVIEELNEGEEEALDT